MTSSGWVIVASYGAVYEADIAKAMLAAADIPSQVLGEHIGIFGPGWSGPTIRGVDLVVPAALLDDAREVLEGDGGDDGGGHAQVAA